jgi:hypothetical protein
VDEEVDVGVFDVVGFWISRKRNTIFHGVANRSILATTELYFSLSSIEGGRKYQYHLSSDLYSRVAIIIFCFMMMTYW